MTDRGSPRCACIPPSRRTIALVASLALALASSAAFAQASALRAPNVVEISPHLVTAGQPSAETLAGLAALGFGAVVYLAPPTVSDAVRDEALIVGRQGLVYVNIPIRFEGPTETDLEAFAGVLRGLAGRKVLVHCQVNMRASTIVLLYRASIAKEDPRSAYDSVTCVWAPHVASARCSSASSTSRSAQSTTRGRRSSSLSERNSGDKPTGFCTETPHPCAL